MDRPKHRRLIFLGLALLGGGVLLFGHPWTPTTEPTPVSAKQAAPQVVEPPADRTEPAPVEAAAPAAPTVPSAQTGTFRGRVIDATTRQPVPEFEVQLIGMPRGHIRGNEPRVTQIFQASDGRFAWQQAPAGNWNVLVTAQRYQQFHVAGVSIAAGKATREVIMPLRRGHTLKGRVFDQISGAGIGDAWIAARDPSVPWPSPGSPRGRSERTKGDGTFVLDGVPSGDMIVIAHAKDHAPREIAVIVNDATPPLEIGLTTGGKIAGMVVAPDGTPAQGMLMLAGPGTPYASRLDETGSFSFANRPAGRYRLTANTAAGNARLDFELAENEIKEGILLKVSEGRSVRGVIKGLRPEQLARTFVSVHSESKPGNFSATPDEQGAYAVKGVPPGRAQVSVDADMSRYANKSVDVPADQDVVLDIVFPPGARLSGHVTQGAKPAADRTIWVGSPGGKADIGYRARTAQDGGYEIDGVPPGEYRVSVDRDATRVVTIAGDAVVNFDIPLVQIGGRVVEEGGTVPIVGAGVHLVGSEPQTAHVRNYKESDDFGQFQLAGVDPGEIVLTVYKLGYEMHREKIAYSSPITNKTIALRKSAGVEVRVQPASTVEQVRPLFLSEKMPGSEYGIGLWIPLNLEGVGSLPSALAGSTLRIQRSGSLPIVVEKWEGQSLDLKFQSRH